MYVVLSTVFVAATAGMTLLLLYLGFTEDKTKRVK
jgi:hypothetical protein